MGKLTISRNSSYHPDDSEKLALHASRWLFPENSPCTDQSILLLARAPTRTVTIRYRRTVWPAGNYPRLGWDTRNITDLAARLINYLEIIPAKILCYRCELLPSLKSIPNLLFEDLDSDERVAREQIEQLLINTPSVPTFLLIGGLLGEETRRKLRILSIDHPLYFIEVNNAPNHLSLAREAKLVQRVMRLITPAIFATPIADSSTVFIAGNADFLSVMENVHFNLKGTPSASEVEFLIYLLEQKQTDIKTDTPAKIPHGKPSFDGLGLGVSAELVLPQLAERTEWLLDTFIEGARKKVGSFFRGNRRKNRLVCPTYSG